MQEQHCDLKVTINGQHAFFLHQRAVCAFSGRLRKMVSAKRERKRSHLKFTSIKIADFPGGPTVFELIARFCYNSSSISKDPSSLPVLHCAAAFLEMTEDYRSGNLLSQTESFLAGHFYWNWKDIISSLKSCESCPKHAESTGLLGMLISSLLQKISPNSDIPIEATTPLASSSSSSSPDTSGFRFSSSTSSKTPESSRHLLTKEWWFDDMTILHPFIIEHVVRQYNAFGGDKKSLVITRFLLHYLKSAGQRRGGTDHQLIACGGLADTVVNGVVSAILEREAQFSCKILFWMRRVLGGLGLSMECRRKLERLMGSVLDQATLDDLLVCGVGAVYDVGLVVRLVGVFISAEDGELSLQRVKKVGRLVDNYLREVSPDPSLEPSKFMELAQILPDHARDCYDGIYRALEVYLESHRKSTVEDRSRLCQCLNYEKLTLEACRDLAKNPWIPPREAVQALMSRKSSVVDPCSLESPIPLKTSRVMGNHNASEECEVALKPSSSVPADKEGLVLSTQRMQQFKMMRGQQLPRMVKNKRQTSSTSNFSSKEMPRLC